MTEDEFFQRKAAEREAATIMAANEALMVLAGKWSFPSVAAEEQSARAESVLKAAAASVAKCCRAPFCASCRFYMLKGERLVNGESFCSLIDDYRRTRERLFKIKGDLASETTAADAARQELDRATDAIGHLNRDLPAAESDFKAVAECYGVEV